MNLTIFKLIIVVSLIWKNIYAYYKKYSILRIYNLDSIQVIFKYLKEVNKFLLKDSE